MGVKKLGMTGCAFRGTFWTANIRAVLLTLTLLVVVGLIIKFAS